MSMIASVEVFQEAQGTREVYIFDECIFVLYIFSFIIYNSTPILLVLLGYPRVSVLSIPSPVHTYISS